jgi:formate hydrogenlyase transcriptional activator
MSAPTSFSKRDPAPAASNGPKENEAGQPSKLAHLESLLSAQRRTLDLISAGAGLTEILQDLCDSVDAHSPEIISSVLLMDPDGKQLRPAAGRKVPGGWAEAIDPVTIGPCVGSCGTAAFFKKQVIVSDIASDPLWVDFRDVALRNGLRAAWSQPLISKTNEVLGTFCMYYANPRSPTVSDLRLVEGAAHVALIGIQSDRSRTALQQAGQEIKQSEARLRKIIDTIPTLAWCSLPDGTGEFWNRRWHEYTGLTPEAVRGWGWQDAIHPEDLREITDKWLGFLASGRPGEVEGRLRRFDGVYRWFLFRAEPLRDESGNIVNWYGTDTDIENLKRAEGKLRQDERELRQLIDFLPQHVVVLDTDGFLLHANQMMLAYYGRTLEEMQGAGTNDRIKRDLHPDDLERVRGERRRGLSSGLPFEIEKRMLGKDGRYRWFLFRYRPLLDEQGRVARWFATATDIEDRKRAEERVRNENVALREDIVRSSMFEEIVGSSEALRQVLTQVSKVAPTDSTVLILGETGTGKELIARAIHNRSKRSSRAFIRVNCGAIQPSLITSELFGYEKGAFTGALQRRLGRFESADGGTIFLDEAGELSLETQITLLRVLQEREFERVGGSQTVSVDVRVLAATNSDLSASVDKGTFRQDLFYRLNVFPIRVPALRERADDIPLLAQYLVDRYAQKAGKRIRNISKNTLDLLQAYDWPGNIRELQNVIERAVILCDGETFCVDETWLKRESPISSGPTLPLAAKLSEQEKEIIEAALAECQGQVSGPAGAAAKLGIPRQTLEWKIRRLGIDRHQFKTA